MEEDNKSTSATKTETKQPIESSDKKESGSKTSKASKAIAGIAALVMVGCGAYAGYVFMNSKDADKPENKQDKTVKTGPNALRLENNELSDFDLEFLKKENKEINKAYSPMSIKYALSMLKDGADGESKAQIENLIGDYKPTAYVNTENRSIANALFVNEKYNNKVKQDYIDGLKDKYVASLLFDSFESAGKVNSWTSDNTKGLVKDLLNDDAVKPDETLFVLVNALAIDMDWTNKIQCATEDGIDDENEAVPDLEYNVHYSGEKYDERVLCRGFESVENKTMNFNGQENTKTLEIGASINRYDILNELGEDSIRQTITEARQQYLDEWYSNPDHKAGIDEGYVDSKEVAESKIEEVVNEQMTLLKEGNGFNTADKSTDFQYYTDDTVKAFAKDLKEYEGTTLQYVAIMPKEEALNNFIENQTASDIQLIINNLKSPTVEDSKDGVITKITGLLPVFNFDYELQLKDDLKALGVTEVFDIDKANLGNITDEQAYIADAVHKTNIDFSNTGIKAAAATAWVGGLGGASDWTYRFEVPVEEIDLTIDKPYLFLIRDKKTGEVWFTGTVYKPTAK